MMTPASTPEDRQVYQATVPSARWRASTVPWRLWLATIGAFLILMLLIGVPYVALAQSSLYAFNPVTQTRGTSLTLEHYYAFITGSAYQAALSRSLQISLWTTIICLVLGLPVAYVMARGPRHLRTFLLVVVVSSLMINVVIRTFAWLIILAQGGPVNTLLGGVGIAPMRWLFNSTGVTIGLVHVLLPYMVLPLYNAVVSIPTTLEDAAMSLGASPSIAFVRVVLPLTVPGLIAGSAMVFTLAMSSYVTPAVLGGGSFPVLTMLAADEILISLNFPRGSALAVIVVGVTLLCLRCGHAIATRMHIQRG